MTTTLLPWLTRRAHCFILFCCFLFATNALDNGLALTPPMGISTWSIFKGDINHSLVVNLTDAMVDLELLNAGYEYLLVDAGWTTSKPNCIRVDGSKCLPHRDKDGNLVVDTSKFPNLTDTIAYVHSKGLKFGLWFGAELCADTNDVNQIQVDYAMLDATFFASIGVDAIKHDACGTNVPHDDPIAIQKNYAKYQAMSQALNRTGRPILYDATLQVNLEPRRLPAYDYNYIWSPEPYPVVHEIANMWWSVPVNKYNCWHCCVHPNEFIVTDEKCNSEMSSVAAWRGLLPTLDVQDMGTVGFNGHWDWAGPSKGWNHLDQLGICVGKSWYGPGLTRAEQVAQVSLWTILASPMIVSVDLRNMAVGDDCHLLIANPHVVAVHQDVLGVPGRRLKNNYQHSLRGEESEPTIIDTQLWGRPLSEGRVALVFFNRAETKRNISATFKEMGLQVPCPCKNSTVSTFNVWTGDMQRGLTSPLTAVNVPPHGVTFLVVTPDEIKEQPCPS